MNKSIIFSSCSKSPTRTNTYGTDVQPERERGNVMRLIRSTIDEGDLTRDGSSGPLNLSTSYVELS